MPSVTTLDRNVAWPNKTPTEIGNATGAPSNGRRRPARYGGWESASQLGGRPPTNLALPCATTTWSAHKLRPIFTRLAKREAVVSRCQPPNQSRQSFLSQQATQPADAPTKRKPLKHVPARPGRDSDDSLVSFSPTSNCGKPRGSTGLKLRGPRIGSEKKQNGGALAGVRPLQKSVVTGFNSTLCKGRGRDKLGPLQRFG